MTEAYPLQWPMGKSKTKAPIAARFKSGFGAARDALMRELKLMGAKNIVLSTNIPLNRNGMPYATYKEPDEKGVAIYFQYKEKSMCFACDRWNKIADNIQAVRKTIEAIRGIERWGGGTMMEEAFRGFEALPPPSKNKWWDTLGVNPYATAEEIKAAYRKKAAVNHPDKGGNADAMAEINSAYREATS